MSRKLRYDIPGTDFRVDPDAVREKGWAALFGRDPALHGGLVLEIGYCRGEFMMDLAAKHPERSYVGIECSFKRTLKMARRLARTTLENIRIVQGYGEPLVPELFDDASLAEIWINFPDPWPKRNHAERRIVRAEVVELLAEKLVPGGVLEIATDDAAYAEQMDRVLAASTLENVNAPARWLSEVEGRTPTAYELEWRALGRRLHFFTHRRRVA